MRRIHRRLLLYTNAVVFGVLLCVILYVNHGGPSPRKTRTFDWSTVRYKTPASSLPEARGRCPGLKKNSKKPVLVVSRVEADGNATWLKNLETKYHFCVYSVDASRNSESKELQVPANRGHEAMPYLTFLIDNYDNIPSMGAVFVHGSRFSWHNDEPHYDNAYLLKHLNVQAAMEPYGYHNLRCDWSASTCPPKDSPAQGSLETAMSARLQPWAAKAVSDSLLPQSIETLFGDQLSKEERLKVKPGRKDAVRSQCCAQFAVSRERIQAHSKDEYTALRQWLLDGNVSGRRDAAPLDDRVSGRILSYLWHILFMKGEAGTNLEQLNKKACPTASDCYCRLYGRCGLRGCSAGKCPGQYAIPQGFKLPNGWEEKFNNWDHE